MDAIAFCDSHNHSVVMRAPMQRSFVRGDDALNAACTTTLP
jgi:hypothetical protein